ncbi:folate transporter 1-like [Adelges cooleyi]|uniref:folate transporter 1-like n=1 Tax=Adelges cooleyi TaxID=133065 RepID=UPI00217F3042|nr:folate transporter 1-like [Adelges cooleyi]XP_050422138.1 folate transporter 1-like [Adelges cooleyi]XP_050422139.1 folate transporter 1-like [Adelges cooleyi]
MEQWKKVCYYVSVFVVLREMRPLETFIITYIMSLSDEYSIATIKSEMFPLSIYISVLLIIICFLITDYLRYKPIIIMNGLCGITYFSLLLGSPNIIVLNISQIFHSIFRASEIAHFSYMFAKINDKNQYQIANSRVRTALMIGKFSFSLLAQVLLSTELATYTDLLYLSIFGMSLCTLWACIMPSVNISMYFYKETVSDNMTVGKNQETIQMKNFDTNDLFDGLKPVNNKMKWSEVLWKLSEDFKMAYTDLNVVKWSIWWAMTLTGYILVMQYMQLIWQEIYSIDNHTPLMNGAVESAATLLSAAATYTLGRMRADWDKYGELCMSIVAFGQAVLLYLLAFTNSLKHSYIYYIMFCCSYQTMLTISSAEVAKFLKRDCFALIFGFNKFIAYILITVFTAIVVEDTFFNLHIRQQFFIYSVYYGVLGCLFISLAIITLTMRLTRKTHAEPRQSSVH